MTRNQITKKLEKAGIDMVGLEISSDQVEVYMKTKKGEFSQRLTDSKVKQVENALGWRSGFRAGYGGWVIQPSGLDMGEWNDKGSRWHY